MPSPLVAYYVTSHGFGHATRAAAVAAELERVGARVVFRTGVPAWLFADEGLAAAVEPADGDAGLAMRDALTVDVAASLAEHEALGRRWEALAREQAGRLRAEGAALVVSDAGALALEAAARAGLPSALAANFSWDWVVEPWAGEDGRWEAVRRRMAEAYARARLFLRLPLGGDAPACPRREEAPLVVRSASLDRGEARRRLGLDPADPRPVVAYSFGGVDGGTPALDPADGLADFRFVAYGPRPEGLRGEWLRLPKRTPLRHRDIIAAADVVLTKPGYGTFSEVLAARVPALVVPRDDFRESALITASLLRLGRARLLPRADFAAGRWGAGLRALLASRAPWSAMDVSGAAFVARRLLELA